MHTHRIGPVFTSPLVLWSFAVLLVVSAYFPGLHGPLVFDDQLNIVENPGVAITDFSFASLKTALLSNESGMFKRVLPALSFGINHALAGGFADTFVFKVTNLVIHCVNSALVFWLLYRLWPLVSLSREEEPDRSRGAVYGALFCTLLWALHPLQLTSVLYVVQRMTSMAGTFALLGLCLFLRGRLLLRGGRPEGVRWMYAGILSGTALGLACKENAALLPLYAGVIEFTLFERSSLAKKPRRELWLFFTLLLFVPAVAGVIYLFIYPGGLLQGYVNREFSLNERLLTELRVLWFYLYMLALPDIKTMGLFHDDLSLSRGLLTPATTLFSLAAWLVTISLGILFRRKFPLIAFGLFWYLAGHAMESTVIPLQLIHEHRNYLPAIGPIFAVGRWVMKPLGSDPARFCRGLAAAALVIGLFLLTFQRAENWSSENRLIERWAANHPDSPTVQYLMGEVLQKKYKDPRQAYGYYFKAARLQPEEVGYRIALTMVTPVEVIKEVPTGRYSHLIEPPHIGKLLERGPISAWTMRALDVASQCVRAAYRPCVTHRDYVGDWLDSVSKNGRISKLQRRYFLLRKFEIEMKYRFFHDALGTILEAKANFPESGANIALMHADVLAALRRYAEAEKILTAAENALTPEDEKYRPTIETARRAVAAAANRPDAIR